MFLDFLLFLRAGKLNVSLHDWLALMDGMYKGLHGQSLQGFYILARTLLVKRESDLDRFEELFYLYFKNVSSEDLRKELSEHLHNPDVLKQISDCMGLKSPDLEKMLQTAELRLAADDISPEISAVQAGISAPVMNSKSAGIGAGPGSGSGSVVQGAGGKSVVHARGTRIFRDWRTDCTIESRQFQMAFRLLRELSRKLESSEEELDIRGTIDSTCRRGGILDIRMQPPRKNRLKVMILIDSGGSMRPYEQLCSLLFQSLHKANTFSDLKIYYFHNCPEEILYRDPSIDTQQTVKTDWVLRNISGEYKVIFIGDADMAMHELVGSPYSSSFDSSPDGITWFKRFREKYRHSIWLHPQEREENIAWMSESFIEIEKIFPMFRLSIDGLKEGMYRLMKDR